MRVVAAHFQRLRVIAHAQHLAPADVARDFGDRVHPHQGRAVDAPEFVGVEFVRQFFERFADEKFGRGRLHARVFFVRLEEQDLARTHHAQAAAHLRLDPAQVGRLWRGALLLEQAAQLGQLGADVLRGLRQAAAQALAGGGEAFGRHGFEQVVDCAMLEGVDRVLVVGGGEDDVAAVEQLARRFDAAHAGHADVEKGDLRLVARGQFHRFDAVRRHRNHIDLGPDFEQACVELLAHRCFVVGDQGSHPHHASSIILYGMRTEAQAPPPGGASITSSAWLPYSSCRR